MPVATMTSTATKTIELPPEPGSPAVAREFVTAALRHSRVAPETVDVARLLTSELVTNAVMHAGTPITVSVRVTERRVHVTVDDAEVTCPSPAGDAELDTHGRGLTIVDRLAHHWGVDRRQEGKSVWFELRTTRS
jgi:anti-sigma regulatory factor (Ser/Thr protein kinase)